ncbi:glycosyltransferase family 69 protein [Calycina marina]|uniref:Glycosyltransferase family 69 protein n=1 Tax=Calycina marina TaxID=1763456 RepID=A0A9P7Z5C5_9HELO|nr:glycosyltransferase family 69 protein [Calycina marina]
MLLISRSFRRRFLRTRSIVLVLLCLLALDAVLIAKSLSPSTRVYKSSRTVGQKIFIASMFRNSEYILRMSWSNALLTLVQDLGPENVYISITESGSLENTKGALLELGGELQKLGVKHRILTGINHLEQQDMLRALPEEGKRQGWVYTGRPESKAGKEGWEMRRLPYLASLRNQVLEPLLEGPEGEWDKILWINDVVFTVSLHSSPVARQSWCTDNNYTEDVLTLLQTNHGSYSAACSLDFQNSATDYYDTFALRDSNGHKTATHFFPFFHNSASLEAMRANTAIPVKSCWNGMTVFDAAPFYGANGLRFRGVEDSLAAMHVEGSECCLIHADNPLRDTYGVFANPSVRVSYNISTYEILNPSQGERIWPHTWDMVTGVWANRRARWFQWFVLHTEGAVIRRRLKKWENGGKKSEGGVAIRKENGVECLVNELQVLYYNGWQHV